MYKYLKKIRVINLGIGRVFLMRTQTNLEIIKEKISTHDYILKCMTKSTRKEVKRRLTNRRKIL